MIAGGRLRNASLDCVVAERVATARTPLERTTGLLGRRNVLPDEGMWFDRCRSIHTIGMRVPIDVIFLDANGSVVDVRWGVRPNRPLVWNARARSLVELGAAPGERADIRIGDRLALDGR